MSMASTISCKDGSIEVLHEYSMERVLQLVEDHIGPDAVDYIDDVHREMRRTRSDDEDWEQVSDGYRNMLVDTMRELESALGQFRKRLNRDKLYIQLVQIHDNIYKNI